MWIKENSCLLIWAFLLYFIFHQKPGKLDALILVHIQTIHEDLGQMDQTNLVGGFEVSTKEQPFNVIHHDPFYLQQPRNSVHQHCFFDAYGDQLAALQPRS